MVNISAYSCSQKFRDAVIFSNIVYVIKTVKRIMNNITEQIKVSKTTVCLFNLDSCKCLENQNYMQHLFIVQRL